MLSSCELKSFEQNKSCSQVRRQRTFSEGVEISGKCLFTGKHVSLQIFPKEENHGIVFSRLDLPGQPTIKALATSVVNTPRCTILGNKDFQIISVEHILSALKGLGIDNALIALDGPEIPIGDGSSQGFVKEFEKAGISEQDAMMQPIYLDEPIFWEKNGMSLIAIPAKELTFSYTLNYPGHPLLDAQFYRFVFSEEKYIEEIAPSRTFSLYEEVIPLLEKGIIKGGSSHSGVVIKGSEIFTGGKLRFPEEMARHKILDLIGDISLVGYPVVAHFIAICSGHLANTEVAKILQRKIDKGFCNETKKR